MFAVVPVGLDRALRAGDMSCHRAGGIEPALGGNAARNHARLGKDGCGLSLTDALTQAG